MGLLPQGVQGRDRAGGGLLRPRRVRLLAPGWEKDHREGRREAHPDAHALPQVPRGKEAGPAMRAEADGGELAVLGESNCGGTIKEKVRKNIILKDVCFSK